MGDILLGTEMEGGNKVLALKSLWLHARACVRVCACVCVVVVGVSGEKQNTQQTVLENVMEEGSGDMERFG